MLHPQPAQWEQNLCRKCLHQPLHPDQHRKYACLIDEWVSTVGLDKREYDTHSMRRTKASLIYKATGNLRAVQILLGHTNIENTVRYLGADVDDALTLSERTEI